MICKLTEHKLAILANLMIVLTLLLEQLTKLLICLIILSFLSMFMKSQRHGSLNYQKQSNKNNVAMKIKGNL